MIELFISEHTVARHVQNIFAKLTVSSRAAATAFAFPRPDPLASRIDAGNRRVVGICGHTRGACPVLAALLVSGTTIELG